MSKRLSKIGWIVLFALLCLALVGLPACSTTPAEEEEEEEQGVTIPYKNDGMFIQMTIGEPETLDPAAGYDTTSGEADMYVYEPLLYYKGESLGATPDEFTPVLAESWTWNEAALTWTFKIRKGVKFQNGDTLTPEDVEYSFERLMTQDRVGGPALVIDVPLVGVEAYADTTWAAVDASVEVSGDNVVFKLFDIAFKMIFLQAAANSWGVILDKKWCIENGDWDGTEADIANHYQVEPNYLWTHMNGTGPWKLNQWEQGVQIKFEKNANYWGAPAPFDWVINQLAEEWTVRKEAILAGDADYVAVPRQYIHELDGISDLQVHKDMAGLLVFGFFMVLDINPTSPYIGSGKLDGNGIPGNFFADKDVREGFREAFNYDTFIKDIYYGEAALVGSPVIAGLVGFNPNAQKPVFNLTAAKAHFQNTSFGDLTTIGFKFTMIYNSGNAMRKAACEMLQKNLLSISTKFQVSVQPLSWSTGILPLIKTKDATVYIIGWQADTPHADNFVRPFMSTKGTFAMFQSYGNAGLDAKINAALLEPDPAKQVADYYELQQIFYDDCPGFMLAQPLNRRYFTKYIHGWYWNPMHLGEPGPLYYMSKSES
jgi:peptide/nickel transport system substrate-binding protein